MKLPSKEEAGTHINRAINGFSRNTNVKTWNTLLIAYSSWITGRSATCRIPLNGLVGTTSFFLSKHNALYIYSWTWFIQWSWAFWLFLIAQYNCAFFFLSIPSTCVLRKKTSGNIPQLLIPPFFQRNLLQHPACGPARTPWQRQSGSAAAVSTH